MKKVLLSVLAVGMLTACSQDETVDMQASSQIAFAGAFVDNVTRAAVDPSITNEEGKNPITNFDVWGFMDNANGEVFTREEVTKSGNDWTYVNTQYWLPNHTYYFAAVAPAQSENITVVTPTDETAEYGLGTINFTNEDGGEDLLYAAVAEPIKTGNKIEQQPAPVFLNFGHMLSKVKFTFKNGFTNPNTTIKITNIEMTAPKTGSINVAQADWWSTNQWVLGNESFKLNFSDNKVLELAATADDECARERFTFPANKEQEYTVTFHVQLYQGDVLAIEGKRTAKISGVALEIGKAYNFTAELNASNLTDDVTENPLFPITFTVDVKEWIDVENEDLITTVGGAIASDMTLVSNAETTATVSLADGVTFDGAGHTMSITEGTNAYLEEGTLRLMKTMGDASIMNLTIDGNDIVYDADNNPSTTKNNYGIRGIFLTGNGDVTIDNVTIKNVTYTLNDTGNKTLKVINSKFEGWTSFTSEEAIFENVEFTKGVYGRVRPYNKVVLKNCSFGEGVVVDAKFEPSTGVIKHPVVEFINCTYKGQPITQEIVESTLCYSLDNDFSKVTIK